MYKKLYPLKFIPILQGRVWGGGKLVGQFGKSLPTDEDGKPVSDLNPDAIGESWEICAMDEERDGVAANGFLEGSTLGDILETYMGELVGDNIFEYYGQQFPLLIKFLDVKDRLSVQVHPDDKTAFERCYEYGKTECWYVMEAEETARIYMGFKKTTTAAEFYEKCKNGTAEELLRVYKPHAGEFFHIPAGTVHACGGGLVIAEVQEPSDMTYRLYDWGRELNPATAREMHLDEAIDCIDYNPYDDKANHTDHFHEVGVLSDCKQFTVTGMHLEHDAVHIYNDEFDSCIVYICTEGGLTVQTSGADGTELYPLSKGECILVPASLDDFFLVPTQKGTTVLEAHIRKIEEESDDYINEGTEEHCCDDDDCDCGHHHEHNHGHCDGQYKS